MAVTTVDVLNKVNDTLDAMQDAQQTAVEAVGKVAAHNTDEDAHCGELKKKWMVYADADPTSVPEGLKDGGGVVVGNVLKFINKNGVLVPIGGGDVPLPATATPQALGTASVGTSTKYAREDHVHDKPSATDISDLFGDGLKVDNDKIVIDFVNKKFEEISLSVSIVYPNGGSASSPANVKTNTRYVLDNPFQGYHVICFPEIQLNGQWGSPGWFTTYNSDVFRARGIKANQLLPDDKIIVQTGSAAISQESSATGNPFGVTKWASYVTEAPCRVFVVKLKSI